MLKRLLGPLLVLLALVGLVAACGDDDDDGTAANGATTTAPEEKRAPDDQVAEGLQAIDELGSDIYAAVQAGNTDEAKDLLEQIEPTWEDIEGTVKANDESAYLTFEDSFAALGLAIDDKDAGKAQKAAADISGAVAIYLQAHPA